MNTNAENDDDKTVNQTKQIPIQTPNISVLNQLSSYINALIKSNHFYWILILIMFCIVLVTAITQKDISFWTKSLYSIVTIIVILLTKYALNI